MVSHPRFPTCRLVEEDSGSVLFVASAIERYFVEPGSDSRDVVLVGEARLPVQLGEVLSDAVELHIIDVNGRKIGEDYIGRLTLSSEVFAADGTSRGFTANFHGARCEEPLAEAIWQRWASGRALEGGEWMQYPVAAHDTWLGVAQNSWFATGHRPIRYGVGDACVLDGRNVSGAAGLYCAIGEAVNGPGGYFGATLNGLIDCLSTARTWEAPFELVWTHSAEARSLLDADELGVAIEALERYGVIVTLS